MAWENWNPNPMARTVGDCALRAIAKALDVDWETAFALTAVAGFNMGNIQNGDEVWGSILRSHGFFRDAIPNTCPDCYTVSMFAKEHPRGVYVLSTGGHVVCVENGNWFDTWNSGSEAVQFYWYRKEE